MKESANQGLQVTKLGTCIFIGFVCNNKKTAEKAVLYQSG